MSRFQFELMTRLQAIEILADRKNLSAETYPDRIRAYRRLRPVTTPEEREAVRRFNAERARERAR